MSIELPVLDYGATWPPLDTFAVLAEDRRVIPVVRRLLADGETPLGLYRKLTQGRPGTFLLESAEQGGIWSRYSFIGVSSFGVLTQDGDTATWLDYGLSADRALTHRLARALLVVTVLGLLGVVLESHVVNPLMQALKLPLV